MGLVMATAAACDVQKAREETQENMLTHMTMG